MFGDRFVVKWHEAREVVVAERGLVDAHCQTGQCHLFIFRLGTIGPINPCRWSKVLGPYISYMLQEWD